MTNWSIRTRVLSKLCYNESSRPKIRGSIPVRAPRNIFSCFPASLFKPRIWQLDPWPNGRHYDNPLVSCVILTSALLSREGLLRWGLSLQVLIGNNDQNTRVYNNLNPSIKARYIRFNPVESITDDICMRVAVYKCRGEWSITKKRNIVFRVQSLPPFFPPGLPPSVPPSLPSFLPSFLPHSLLPPSLSSFPLSCLPLFLSPSFPSFLPSFLPASLPPCLPAFLPPSLPPSVTVSALVPLPPCGWPQLLDLLASAWMMLKNVNSSN